MELVHTNTTTDRFSRAAGFFARFMFDVGEHSAARRLRVCFVRHAVSYENVLTVSKISITSSERAKETRDPIAQHIRLSQSIRQLVS